MTINEQHATYGCQLRKQYNSGTIDAGGVNAAIDAYLEARYTTRSRSTRVGNMANDAKQTIHAAYRLP